MRRRIGKGAIKPEAEKEKLEVVKYIENNVQNNLALRRDHLYLEDVKTAININTLEQRIILRKKIIDLLESELPKERIKGKVSEALEKDRHRLTKHYRVK